MNLVKLCAIILPAVLALHETQNAGPIKLTGGGSSIQAPIQDLWARTYQNVPNVKAIPEYKASASIFGIEEVLSNKLAFAGSEIVPQTMGGKFKSDLLSVPLFASPIVFAFNLPDISDIVLSRDALVGIFNGTIATWDHPMILNMNPAIVFPANPIKIVLRKEPAGTTALVSATFGKINPEWSQKFGSGPIINSTSQTAIHAEQSKGVSAAIKNEPFSIGFMTLHTAREDKLSIAKLINKRNEIVQASVETSKKAMENINGDVNDLSYIDSDAAGAYPFTIISHGVINKAEMRSAHGQAAHESLKYFHWILSDNVARGMLSAFDYLEFPKKVLDTIVPQIQKIINNRKA